MTINELRELALANFDLLLDLWGLEYKNITEWEYDIIAKWRDDKNYGGCRFNTRKARGADFAGGCLTDEDFFNYGNGFDSSDFVGFSLQGQSKVGFDVIGFAQRVYANDSYKDTARLVARDLAKISNKNNITADTIAKRVQAQKDAEKKAKNFARDIWESCKYHRLSGSVGEKYLFQRGITKVDPNIRFHPGITYTPTKTKYPALIFRVQNYPDGPFVAIHRIYIDPITANKADIDNPKMALAPIKGSGIWFGDSSNTTLALTEGPENALSLLSLGHPFVVSTIFGTNLHNLTIPLRVKHLLIYPDVDKAGMEALERAKLVYGALKIEVSAVVIPKIKLDNNKTADINDLLKGGIEWRI